MAAGKRFRANLPPLGWSVYFPASAYFDGFSSAVLAQSSQHTVISLPPTLTLIPPSLMSQSHTGHFAVFISVPFSYGFLSFSKPLLGFQLFSTGGMIRRRGISDFQILAHFAQAALAGREPGFGRRDAEFFAKGVGEMAVAGKTEFQRQRGQIVGSIGQSFQRSSEP